MVYITVAQFKRHNCGLPPQSDEEEYLKYLSIEKYGVGKGYGVLTRKELQKKGVVII